MPFKIIQWIYSNENRETKITLFKDFNLVLRLQINQKDIKYFSVCANIFRALLQIFIPVASFRSIKCNRKMSCFYFVVTGALIHPASWSTVRREHQGLYDTSAKRRSQKKTCQCTVSEWTWWLNFESYAHAFLSVPTTSHLPHPTALLKPDLITIEIWALPLPCQSKLTSVLILKR